MEAVERGFLRVEWFNPVSMLKPYGLRRYYREAYAPVPLTVARVGVHPGEQHLTDVPWIGADIQASHSVSLQMIAAQQAIVRPRRYFDFLMAFSYGARYMPAQKGFFPGGTDPEIGLRNAAPYLGMVRRYYVTRDAGLYLDALRYYLSQHYPVRLALDRGELYDRDQFVAHSDVLVGYDTEGFYYYEPVCLAPATCAPGERVIGDPGLYVRDAVLLKAVQRHARRFAYPWRYAFTTFEPGPTRTDLTLIWTHLAEATLGGRSYGPKMGVVVLENLARRVRRWGRRFDGSVVQSGLTLAVRFRRDNARYLRDAFPTDTALQRASVCFEAAADCYEAALGLLTDRLSRRAARQVAGYLQDAVALERETGEIFRAHIRKSDFL